MHVAISLQWRHNGCDGVSNHQPHSPLLLNLLFRRRSKKTSELRVTGLCAGNSPGTGEFPAQMASNAENGSIWWRYHVERIGYQQDIRYAADDNFELIFSTENGRVSVQISLNLVPNDAVDN